MLVPFRLSSSSPRAEIRGDVQARQSVGSISEVTAKRSFIARGWFGILTAGGEVLYMVVSIVLGLEIFLVGLFRGL